MITLTLYTRDECQLCDQTIADLEALKSKIPHELVIVNIDGNRKLQQEYGQEIPVVEVGPFRLKAPITRQDLEVTLNAAVDRARALEEINQADLQARLLVNTKITKTDRFSYWLAKHYMAFFNGLVILYLGLPFLAPTLMSAGLVAPANVIYRFYGLVCHQFAFRSWFLFGEQTAYPRTAAGIQGLATYGQATGLDEVDQWAARQFIGNNQIGYKVALCQRDVAIYGGILVFGLLFGLTGRRFNSFPWYLWIAIGIMPIAIDGMSQLLSQPPLNAIPLLSLLPYRESTPFLRTLTGFLFGFTTAWFGYPMVEETMSETKKFMARKFALKNGKEGARTKEDSGA